MAQLYRHLRVHQIFGANTDVGKTVLTTALIRASVSQGKRVFYLKPVSTGPLKDADDEYVKRYSRGHERIHVDCLYRYAEPVSPHLAVRMEERRDASKISVPSDSEFTDSVCAHLRRCATSTIEQSDAYIETAGGVHSPTLSGISQVDGYRALRLPTILIGESKLGGISSTISSYESLALRGYTIDSIILFREDYYRNWEYLSSYFSERGIHVASFPLPPPKTVNSAENFASTEQYYQDLELVGSTLSLVQHLDERHKKRIDELDSMPRRTLNSVWWPFVQHGLVQGEKDVTVIDSAHGDFFSIYDRSDDGNSGIQASLLRPQFDGSASWWTQTFGHAHPALALAAARAAGRYGHVMFPQATHLPALKLAERMLNDGPGRGWASRVFFSDDGSTAMEIALKMALRAYAVRHVECLDKGEKQQLGVLGLKGSYHGDTIGAMDACDAGDGVYTCEWHNAKGYWFDPPSVAIRKGKAVISVPDAIVGNAELGQNVVEAESWHWIYDVEGRLDTPLASQYRSYIQNTLARLNKRGFPHLAALVLEPLVMGAAGMIFVDPLFQRVLIDVVRGGNDKTDPSTTEQAWQGLPVIFDEVFVGLYRMGMQSCTPLLGVSPDIAVYAKTLTGGLVPMALTLASPSIFEAFLSDKKADALLHGHSYTAHAVGCEVANETFSMMDKMVQSEPWMKMQSNWRNGLSPLTVPSSHNQSTVWSFWDPIFIAEASHLDSVREVMTLGTVLAIKLHDSVGGYQSHSAQMLLSSISRRSENGHSEGGSFGIHFRTLGNVAYFMSSLNTASPVLRSVEKRILNTLRRTG